MEQTARSGQESDVTRESNYKFSGNEVCYTNPLLSPVKNMMCGNLHCQKVLI